MYFSLGNHCYAANMLKRMGIRRRKSPFDWIFSTPDMVAQCLEDRFLTFLDPANHNHIPVEMRPDPHLGRCGHRIYDAMTPAPVFNHHDPATVAEDRAYLWQAVRNITDAPKDADKFFVMVSAWPADLEVYRRISSALDFVGKRKALFINVYQGEFGRPAQIVDQSDRHEVVSYYSASYLGGISFNDEADNLRTQDLTRSRMPQSLGGPIVAPVAVVRPSGWRRSLARLRVGFSGRPV